MDASVRHAAIFHGVDPTAITALIDQLRPVEFPSGHTIFSEGDPGDELYIIASGKVEIGRRAPDGRESLLTLIDSWTEI